MSSILHILLLEKNLLFVLCHLLVLWRLDVIAPLLHPGGALQDEVGRPNQNQLDGDGRCQGWGTAVSHQVGWDCTHPRRL